MQLYMCVACPIIRQSDHITRGFLKITIEGKTGMHNTNFSLVQIEGLSYFKEPYIEQFSKVTKMAMKGITLEFSCRNLQFLILTSLRRLVASSPGRW